MLALQVERVIAAVRRLRTGSAFIHEAGKRYWACFPATDPSAKMLWPLFTIGSAGTAKLLRRILRGDFCGSQRLHRISAARSKCSST
ncbi:hypothetical protein MES4922_410002 [Mesorhizobium ventifaucium]|uniref:Uncharacterized protein n=1 Tax=Mesorhizobium ventifaucium TaxID=666020 RepID=A0ABN8K6I4_9HYPH|nr:hypothetical protein MES4922_410002 [Mesorhizobium ventifaucium]